MVCHAPGDFGYSAWVSSLRACALEGGFLVFGAVPSFGNVDLSSSTYLTIFFGKALYSAKSVN